jgi:hypothetical protein
VVFPGSDSGFWAHSKFYYEGYGASLTWNTPVLQDARAPLRAVRQALSIRMHTKHLHPCYGILGSEVS